MSPANLPPSAPLLRSEDMQDIIEQEPSWLARWGILLVTVLVLALVGSSYFVNYPDSLELPVARWRFLRLGGVVAEVQLPQTRYSDVHPGQTVLLEFDSYPATHYGYLTGTVSQVSDSLDAQGQFMVRIALPHGLTTTRQHPLTYCWGMTARASIVTRQARLLERVL